jgi:hypothetical protein
MLPDFLRREYKHEELPEEKKRFDVLQEQYFEKFNRGFSTSGFCYSWDEWSEKVEYCLEHDVLMEELTGEALT